METILFGKDAILTLGTSTVTLGGSRGLSMELSMDTIDVTSRDDEGYTNEAPGLITWGFSTDGLLVDGDAALAEIKSAFFNRTRLAAKLTLSDGEVYGGPVYVTSFPIEAPYDDAVTYSVDLSGAGAMTDIGGVKLTPKKLAGIKQQAKDVSK